jgi:uncharacterized protein (TIGR02646 family)
MRYIQKGAEPQDFIDWKNKPSKIVKRYKHLRDEVKKKVYESLIREQGGLCAYCERQLIERDRVEDYHIEHLNPRSLTIGIELDYDNFLCSCLRQTAKGEPLHCGKLKEDKILPVHPLQQDCQSKFTYTAMGEINGVDQDSQDTIAILGLNIYKLIDMRKDVIAPFLSDEIENSEFQSFVTGYISPDPDGKRNAFCSMIEYLFKDLVEVR